MAGLNILMDEIDGWCGTGTGHHGPFPPRPGLRDLLTAVAISDVVVKIGNSRAREVLLHEAEDLYAGAVKQLSGQPLTGNGAAGKAAGGVKELAHAG